MGCAALRTSAGLTDACLTRRGRQAGLTEDRSADCLCVKPSWWACRSAPERVAAQQPAGFQAVLRAALHDTAVTAMALASRAGLLACGDEAGNVSVINLLKARHRNMSGPCHPV